MIQTLGPAANATGQTTTPGSFYYNPPGAFTNNTAIVPAAPMPAASCVTTLATGLGGPAGIALDSAGNVYVADTHNNTLKILAASGAISTLDAGEGFNYPSGVALYKGGGAYVADTYHNAVAQITANGGLIQQWQGFNNPTGVAVDSSGNMYVADQGNNAVKKIAGGATTVYGSGFLAPTGIAFDAEGNLWVADSGNNAVKSIAPGGAVTTVGTGFSNPTGVAVDADGNVYVADNGNDAIKKINITAGVITTLTGSINQPFDVAVDAAGDVYFSNWGDGKIEKIACGGAVTNYSISPALPQGLGINAVTGIISGIPLQVSAQATYTVTASNGGGSACAAVIITVNDVPPCGFYYQTPAILMPNSQCTIPPVFFTGTKRSFGSFSGICDVAVDNTGNVYAVDARGLTKIPAGSSVQILIYPSTALGCVAVDSAGNIYVAGSLPNVVKIAAAGGSQTLIGAGFGQVMGLAIDTTGNVYVADTAQHAIIKIAAVNGSQTVIASAGGYMYVAVDSAGNVYASNLASDYIQKFAQAGASPTQLGTGLHSPRGVAVDGEGNIYVSVLGLGSAEMLPGSVQKIAAGGGSTTPVATAFVCPLGIAVDASGNVYVVDTFPGSPITEVYGPGGTVLSYSLNPATSALPEGLGVNAQTGVISGTPTSGNGYKTCNIIAANTGGSTTAAIEFEL